MLNSDTTIGENVRYVVFNITVSYNNRFNDLSELTIKFKILHSWMMIVWLVLLGNCARRGTLVLYHLLMRYHI